MIDDGLDLLIPDWPAPATVRAISTSRSGGYSKGPYSSLNLAAHVGDDPQRVGRNRQRLVDVLKLPSAPRWLNQVHGTKVVIADELNRVVDADGSLSRVHDVVCVVMTADCLPVLLCNRAGTEVAAIHAGWRGLLGGVLEVAINAMQSPPEAIIAWIGPAIGVDAFEVGNEVREAFLKVNDSSASAFIAHGDRWLADLTGLARQRLCSVGVTDIHGGQWCTYSESGQFFSYRREGVTGRQASLIWLE